MYKLNVVWDNSWWADWAELHESQEYIDLIKDIEDKLSQANARLEKGKGKGGKGTVA